MTCSPSTHKTRKCLMSCITTHVPNSQLVLNLTIWTFSSVIFTHFIFSVISSVLTLHFNWFRFIVSLNILTGAFYISVCIARDLLSYDVCQCSLAPESTFENLCQCLFFYFAVTVIKEKLMHQLSTLKFLKCVGATIKKFKLCILNVQFWGIKYFCYHFT